MGFNSKYKSSEIEEILDSVVYIGNKLSDFVTSQYVDEAIANAIITTLNTEV